MNLRLTIYDLRATGVGVALAGVVAAALALQAHAAEPTIIATNASIASSIANRKSYIPTVGMEGRLEVTLPGTLLEARPVEHKTKVVLRIAETRPRGDAIWYDLRYIGQAPGTYDLRGYLLRTDGSPTNNLPPMLVRIAPLLAENHDGTLVQPTASPLAHLGGYKALITAVAVVWAILFVPLVWRRRKKEVAALPPPREPTLAERLRPLVEQAAAGTLSRDDQAKLERMLLHHWRQKLSLEDLAMAEAVVKLKADPEAGELLRALESWLHRPPGSAQVDVIKILEPYRSLPAT
jgi:hypothetical protein